MKKLRKEIQLSYFNRASGERVGGPETKFPVSDATNFLAQFTKPGISLITTMPSGLGLDFYSEENGIIWIEFYGDVLQSTFVNLAKAHKILERAYSLHSLGPVCNLFSDLVQKWEY
ncbi:MAG TPA: hypothetical protein VGI88_14375 [Verrucomicrobiae bacterium]